MAVHFATDSRLLKDVHTLQKFWFLHANLIGQRCEFFVVAELAELRVEVVHGMAQFVQAQMCFCAQLAVLIECILFEEATNFVTAGEKVLIGRMFVLCGPVAFKYLIDHLEKDPAIFPAGILIGFVVVRILAQTFNELRDYTFNIVTQRVFREISVTTFKHLHSLSLKFHLNRQTGGLSRIIERATKSLETVSQFLMMTILPSMIETIFLSVLLWVWYSPWCSIIMVLTMVAYVVFTINVSMRRLKIVKQMNAYDNTAQTRAIDSLLNFETVKYFGNEAFEVNRYDEVQAVYEKTSRKLKGSLNFLNAGQAIIFSIGLGGMLAFAVKRAAAGAITPGDVAALFAKTNVRELQRMLVFLGSLHEALWQLLVPSKGAAATAQGEAIRISGRLANEWMGNGGINWDADFKKMAKALVELLGSGSPLPEADLAEAQAIVADISEREDDVQRLSQLAVTWVGQNSAPIKQGKPAYKR